MTIKTRPINNWKCSAAALYLCYEYGNGHLKDVQYLASSIVRDPVGIFSCQGRIQKVTEFHDRPDAVEHFQIRAGGREFDFLHDLLQNFIIS